MAGLTDRRLEWTAYLVERGWGMNRDGDYVSALTNGVFHRLELAGSGHWYARLCPIAGVYEYICRGPDPITVYIHAEINGWQAPLAGAQYNQIPTVGMGERHGTEERCSR